MKSERHHKINFTVHKGPICSQDSGFSFYYTYLRCRRKSFFKKIIFFTNF